MRDGWAKKSGRISGYGDGAPGVRVLDPGNADIDGQGNRTANIFCLSAGSLSGAVIGFLAAGYFGLSAAVFVAVAVGLILGWKARGLAE